MDEKKGVGAELQSNAHCYITGKKTVRYQHQKWSIVNHVIYQSILPRHFKAHDL